MDVTPSIKCRNARMYCWDCCGFENDNVNAVSTNLEWTISPCCKMFRNSAYVSIDSISKFSISLLISAPLLGTAN